MAAAQPGGAGDWGVGTNDSCSKPEAATLTPEDGASQPRTIAARSTVTVDDTLAAIAELR